MVIAMKPIYEQFAPSATLPANHILKYILHKAIDNELKLSLSKRLHEQIFCVSNSIIALNVDKLFKYLFFPYSNGSFSNKLLLISAAI